MFNEYLNVAKTSYDSFGFTHWSMELILSPASVIRRLARNVCDVLLQSVSPYNNCVSYYFFSMAGGGGTSHGPIRTVTLLCIIPALMTLIHWWSNNKKLGIWYVYSLKMDLWLKAATTKFIWKPQAIEKMSTLEI